MIKENERSFLKSHIVDKLTSYVMRDFSKSMKDALSLVYESRLYELICDDDLGLYVYSPSYLYEWLKAEKGLVA